MRRLVIATAALAATLVFVVACGGTSTVVDGSDASTTSSSSSSSSSSGSSTSSSSGASGSSSGGSDGGVIDAARDANDPACPSTYSQPAGNCTIGLRCDYDEGHCECLGYCGGAAPDPSIDYSHWSCTAKRTDGCPEDAPADGTPCTSAGKSCDYGTCCIEQIVCTNGAWKSGGKACPP